MADGPAHERILDAILEPEVRVGDNLGPAHGDGDALEVNLFRGCLERLEVETAQWARLEVRAGLRVGRRLED